MYRLRETYCTLYVLRHVRRLRSSQFRPVTAAPPLNLESLNHLDLINTAGDCDTDGPQMPLFHIGPHYTKYKLRKVRACHLNKLM